MRVSAGLFSGALFLALSSCSDQKGETGPGAGGSQPSGSSAPIAGSGGTGDPSPVEGEASGTEASGTITASGAVVLPLTGLVENVLVVSIDTLRWDRLECYGYPRPTSPNLSSIASRGVVFEEARTQAPQTAPAHASLFSSSYPGVHRVINVHGPTPQLFQLPTGLTTLAELLSGADIETGAFVSGGNLTRRMGMDRGFDTWDEQLTDVSDRINRCVRWMLAPDRGRFFAFLHTYQVHAPYLPPREWYEVFADPSYEGPLRTRTEQYLDMDTKEAWEAATGPAYWEGMLSFDDKDVAFLSSLYDGEIRYVDSELRRLWEYLLNAGLLKNTAVIFLSDHGEEFRDHGKYQHDQVYEELLHVPLIVRLPPELEREGFRGRVDDVVELIDVAPTVAELLGVASAEASWSGRSLVSLLSSAGADPSSQDASLSDGSASESRREDRPTFSELVIDPGPKYHRTVLWRGWKYIHIWQKDIDHTWEYLFHLSDDPRERHNLMDSPEQEPQRVLTALRQLLEERSVANAEEAARVGPGGAAEIDDDMLELMLKLGYVGK